MLRFLTLAAAIYAAPVTKPGSSPSTITILHTNDIHAHLDQFNKYGIDCTHDQIAANQCYGGVSRVKFVVDEYRARAPDSTLVFDAGDQFQGTMFYSYYKGNVSAEAMNDIGYDLMTIGNHEFDDHWQNLAKFIKSLDFPVVSANIDAHKIPQFQQLFQPFAVFPKQQLAVIGFITNTTGFISNAGPDISFQDPVPVVQSLIDKLTAQGYKRIIAVSHNGYAEDQDVARRTRGLDAIIGGHSHTYLAAKMNQTTPDSKGPYPTLVHDLDGNPSYVVQAGVWGRQIGHLDLTFDENGIISDIQGAPILLDQSMPQNAALQNKVLAWRSVFDAFGKVQIGQSLTSLTMDKCQTAECPIGDLITDAMLAARQQSDPNIVFSILNSGGIRAGLPQGPILQRDISTMLPFGNGLVDIQLSGADIKELFESVLAKRNRKANNRPVTSFIQIAGLKFSYDSTRPDFDKVTSIQVATPQGGWDAIDPSRVYQGVTLDFLISGGDGNAFFYLKLMNHV